MPLISSVTGAISRQSNQPKRDVSRTERDLCAHAWMLGVDKSIPKTTRVVC